MTRGPACHNAVRVVFSPRASPTPLHGAAGRLGAKTATQPGALRCRAPRPSCPRPRDHTKVIDGYDARSRPRGAPPPPRKLEAVAAPSAPHSTFPLPLPHCPSTALRQAKAREIMLKLRWMLSARVAPDGTAAPPPPPTAATVAHAPERKASDLSSRASTPEPLDPCELQEGYEPRPDCAARFGIDYLRCARWRLPAPACYRRRLSSRACLAPPPLTPPWPRRRHPVAAYGRLPLVLRQALALPTPIRDFMVRRWGGGAGAELQPSRAADPANPAPPSLVPPPRWRRGPPSRPRAACSTTAPPCPEKRAAGLPSWPWWTRRGWTQTRWRGRAGATGGSRSRCPLCSASTWRGWPAMRRGTWVA